MERVVTPHIERFLRGLHRQVARCTGLIAQNRTGQEVIEITRDVAKTLIEMRGGDTDRIRFPPARDSCDYPLIVNN